MQQRKKVLNRLLLPTGADTEFIDFPIFWPDIQTIICDLISRSNLRPRTKVLNRLLVPTSADIEFIDFPVFWPDGQTIIFMYDQNTDYAWDQPSNGLF